MACPNRECAYFCKKPPHCPAKWPHCPASPPAVMTVSVAPHPHQPSVTSASIHAGRASWCQLLSILTWVRGVSFCPCRQGCVESASVHSNRGAWCQLLSMLAGVRAHNSICIALMTYDLRHLLTGLCIISVSSLVRRLFGIWFIF